MKVLVEDTATGLLTALFRWQPGAELTLHEHVEIEQTFVLEGSLVDEEGEVTAGNYVWRPKGNRHSARSPQRARWCCRCSCALEHLPHRQQGQAHEHGG